MSRSICLLLVALILTACSAAPATTDSAAPTAVAPTSEATTPAPEPTATEAPTEMPEPTPAAEPAEVVAISALPYALAASDDAEDQLLDLYYLPDAEAQKPLVIWTHGGGNSRSSGRTLGRLLAREGYVVLAIDWNDHIAPNRQTASVREAIEDASCALRYAAEAGADYGGNPERVIWTGFSAGAWIGGLISFAEGDLEAALDGYAADNDGPAQQVTCTATADPAAVTALVASAGGYPGDFYLGNGVNDRWTAVFEPLREFTALGHNPGLVVRLLHGRLDYNIDTSFEDAETFAAALQDAGYDVELLPQDGGHESFQVELIEQVLALPE